MDVTLFCICLFIPFLVGILHLLLWFSRQSKTQFQLFLHDFWSDRFVLAGMGLSCGGLLGQFLLWMWC